SWRGLEVPETLLSGHHAEIAKWRQEQSRLRTQKNRPDLMK
ncbi:MAG: tRNA (guanosine(37)-N1)-methyltransferase TrmD, partial [Aquiluna sp.]